MIIPIFLVWLMWVGSFGFELEGWKFKTLSIIFNMGIAWFGYKESLIWGVFAFTQYIILIIIICEIIFPLFVLPLPLPLPKLVLLCNIHNF